MILCLLVFLVFVSITVYILQVIALKRKMRENYNRVNLPPISIIKPLKGLDDNLFDNLESFCKQDYPDYEVILSIEDINDPACRVAEKIRNKYPSLVKIIIDNTSKALNPKVKNMIAAYRESKYEYFLISDSNVFVDKDYLRKTLSAMDENTGLVTNLIVGVGGKSIGAKLENLQLNSFVMLSTCFLEKFLRMPCSIGKSMLMRKSNFEEIGGFNAVGNVLAEDYILGKLMHERGKRVVLSNYTIKNVNEFWSLRRFLNRHSRWAKIRWKIAGWKYFLEPINNPLFLASFVPLIYGFTRFSMILFLITCLYKVILDVYVAKLVRFKIGFSFLLIPIKDLMMGVLWFVPLFSNKVMWRGNVYTIGKDTVLFEQRRTWSIKSIYFKFRESLTS
ncbi:ceramide glucosyltransferase [Thermodesulfovibrio sp. 3907-1M]|uniref:Ceramide glucosyltransferase n=1 Tax=Thermodesulfovibrio autotrophicus TaxID=3118333 RepID=A0AAU8GY71_9BACT